MPGWPARSTACSRPRRRPRRRGWSTLLGRIRWALESHGISRPAPDPAELTAAERELLGLVGAGLPIPRIAGRLGLTRPAAEAAVRAAMHKLGARTRTEAALRAAGA